MRIRTLVGLATLWLVSLVLVGTLSAQGTLGQRLMIRPNGTPFPIELSVSSGDDFGFRIEGRRNGVPYGTLVVKIDDQWVPVEFAATVVRSGR